jgi:hypothetical protein
MIRSSAARSAAVVGSVVLDALVEKGAFHRAQDATRLPGDMSELLGDLVGILIIEAHHGFVPVPLRTVDLFLPASQRTRSRVSGFTFSFLFGCMHASRSLDFMNT